MRTDAKDRVSHRCECPDCSRHPNGPTAQEHRCINRLVAGAGERTRRLIVGFLAQQYGRGGITLLHRITGLDRNTIARGLRNCAKGMTPCPVGPLLAGTQEDRGKFPGL